MYGGSWYLIASILAALLVNKASELSLPANFVIAIAMYVIACLFSSYFNLFSFLPQTPFLEFLKALNQKIPLYLTFLNGYLFFLIGRLFAEREQLFSGIARQVLLVLCPLFAYGELVLTMYFSLNVAADCFFALPCWAAVLFQTVKGIQLKPRPVYRRLREDGAFLYLFHFVFLYVFYRLVNALHWTVFLSNIPLTLLIYVIIVLLATGLCRLNMLLCKKRGLGFLKYSI